MNNTHFVLTMSKLFIAEGQVQLELTTMSGIPVIVKPRHPRLIEQYSARDIGIAARRNLGLPGRTPRGVETRIVRDTLVMHKFETLDDFKQRLHDRLQ